MPWVVLGTLTACGQPDAIDATPAHVATACDLNRQACATSTPWGQATVTLSPTPVPVLKPVTVLLSLETAAPLDIQAALSGVDMDMGPNSTRLTRVGDQQWQGKLTIPVCLTGTMQWRLTLDLQDGKSRHSLSHGFAAPVSH